MHNCMVKASNTSEANYGLTRLFYVQINAVYRFYGYDLVIDDALAIVYAIIGHCKIWPHQICRLHCRVKRIRYPIFCVWIWAKFVCPPLRIRFNNLPLTKKVYALIASESRWQMNLLLQQLVAVMKPMHRLLFLFHRIDLSWRWVSLI